MLTMIVFPKKTLVISGFGQYTKIVEKVEGVLFFKKFLKSLVPIGDFVHKPVSKLINCYKPLQRECLR